MTVLELNKVLCGYDDGFRLGPIDLEVAHGDFLGIIGPNGSGKSTLFKALTGEVKVLSGDIFLDGRSIESYSLKERARELSIVMQFAEYSSITVEEYVLMGRMPYRKMFQFYDTKEDLEIADYYIKLTGIEHLRHKRITELSGGEQQMASIASALAQKPKIILLDEATSHLDVTHQIKVLNLMQKLNEECGLTVVIIIHDLNMASEYCSRIVLMKRGGIYTTGVPEDVLTFENIEEVYKTTVLVNSNPVSNKPVIYPISDRRLAEHRIKIKVDK